VDGRLAALAATVERLEAALASKDAREAAMREELAQLQAAQRLSDQRTEAEIAGLSAALMALKRSLEDTARTPPAAAPSDAAASQPAPSQPASSSRDTALLLLISGGFLCVCVSVRLQCL
jgi:chromosome segregation ATPase